MSANNLLKVIIWQRFWWESNRICYVFGRK